MSKIHVLLTFGGESTEHDVSIITASNTFPYFQPEKYVVSLLYITKNGEWLLCDATKFERGCDDIVALKASIHGTPLTVTYRGGHAERVRFLAAGSSEPLRVDVIFNALLGQKGEDGRIQGMWEIFGIPYCGPGVIGAGVGFDKDVMKRLLKEAGLPICKHRTYFPQTISPTLFDEIQQAFGVPFIIKPANSGSSIGVHKIRQASEFADGITDVFRHDTKLIVEEFVDGSELELYCLGVNGEVKTTIIRETVVGTEFYSYEDKYVDERHVSKYIPARISQEMGNDVQRFAKQAYRILEGRGLARIDFFYSKTGNLFVNEINTIPCIMSHANQPPLWELSGISHETLMDLIVTAAFQDVHIPLII